MNRKWTKRLVYGTVAMVALLVATAVVVPSTVSAFGPGGGMEGMRGGSDRGGMMGGFGHGGIGGDRGAERGQLLADALGISLEELQAAQAKAAEAGIQLAVENGDMTQEQADLMLAGMKLRSYLDHQAILAAALGITPDELQAALEDGNLRDLIDDLGIDRETLRESMQAAMEAAIDQAVADGVITAEQAEALKDAKGGIGGKGGSRDNPGRGGEIPGRRGGKAGSGDFSGGFGSWGGDTPSLEAVGKL